MSFGSSSERGSSRSQTNIARQGLGPYQDLLGYELYGRGYPKGYGYPYYGGGAQTDGEGGQWEDHFGDNPPGPDDEDTGGGGNAGGPEQDPFEPGFPWPGGGGGGGSGGGPGPGNEPRGGGARRPGGASAGGGADRAETLDEMLARYRARLAEERGYGDIERARAKGGAAELNKYDVWPDDRPLLTEAEANREPIASRYGTLGTPEAGEYLSPHEIQEIMMIRSGSLTGEQLANYRRDLAIKNKLAQLEQHRTMEGGAVTPIGVERIGGVPHYTFADGSRVPVAEFNATGYQFAEAPGGYVPQAKPGVAGTTPGGRTSILPAAATPAPSTGVATAVGPTRDTGVITRPAAATTAGIMPQAATTVAGRGRVPLTPEELAGAKDIPRGPISPGVPEVPRMPVKTGPTRPETRVVKYREPGSFGVGDYVPDPYGGTPGTPGENPPENPRNVPTEPILPPPGGSTPRLGYASGPFDPRISDWGEGGSAGNRNLSLGNAYYQYLDWMRNPAIPDDVKNSILQNAANVSRAGYAGAQGQINRRAAATGSTAGVPAATAYLARAQSRDAADAERNARLDFYREEEAKRKAGTEGLMDIGRTETGYTSNLLGMMGGAAGQPTGTSTIKAGSGSGWNAGFDLGALLGLL